MDINNYGSSPNPKKKMIFIIIAILLFLTLVFFAVLVKKNMLLKNPEKTGQDNSVGDALNANNPLTEEELNEAAKPAGSDAEENSKETDLRENPINLDEVRKGNLMPKPMTQGELEAAAKPAK